jgi:hypothetical protein
LDRAVLTISSSDIAVAAAAAAVVVVVVVVVVRGAAPSVTPITVVPEMVGSDDVSQACAVTIVVSLGGPELGSPDGAWASP